MSDVKVCKVMTSYGTTLVVLVPNSSNYNALTSAIEKKHANLYGNLYGEVRVTRMDGFLHENDEGAGIGVSYPVCLLYTSPSPRDPKTSRMPSSA